MFLNKTIKDISREHDDRLLRHDQWSVFYLIGNQPKIWNWLRQPHWCGQADQVKWRSWIKQSNARNTPSENSNAIAIQSSIFLNSNFYAVKFLLWQWNLFNTVNHTFKFSLVVLYIQYVNIMHYLFCIFYVVLHKFLFY